MSVDKLIERPVQTLPRDATCREAAQVMRKENIGCVVVAEDGKPLGMVTDRDLVTRVIAEGGDADLLLLEDVMSGEPIYLGGERTVDQVVSAMRDLAIRRVPVVDEAGKLSGIVAMDDLIVMLSEQFGDLATAIRAEMTRP